MKKFMFSALACVAFAFSGFASNEEIQSFYFAPKAPCTVHVKVINPDGETEYHGGKGGTITEKACGEFKVKYLADLKEQKYIFDEKTDVSISWGY